jgi:16S rRNA (adenine1518-N6/adenine1519-N6)-dimethyltransferase
MNAMVANCLFLFQWTAIMNITEIKEIASRYGLAPNKKLGQNFLIDAGTRKKIIAAIEPGPEDSILEIGPGLGALTSSLIQEAGRVTAVEIDRGMSEYLRSRFASMEGFTLVHGDFLKIDLTGSFTTARGR